MATSSEIAAFEDFRFHVGQRVKTKHAGYASGIVVQRHLIEDAGGIQRVYSVRHGAQSWETYREFEIEEIP